MIGRIFFILTPAASLQFPPSDSISAPVGPRSTSLNCPFANSTSQHLKTHPPPLRRLRRVRFRGGGPEAQPCRATAAPGIPRPARHVTAPPLNSPANTCPANTAPGRGSRRDRQPVTSSPWPRAAVFAAAPTPAAGTSVG